MSFQLQAMTFALLSILEAVFNSEFEKSGKNR